MSDENTCSATIKKQIAELRVELEALVEQYGLNHSRVIELSKKLDMLILELS